MGFFSSSQEDKEAREEFFKEFEERVQQKINSLELAEFRADNTVYKELNLKTYRPSIWGLLIFCEKSVYYYVAPQESYMSFFTKGAGRTEEKLLLLTEFSDIRFSMPEKKTLSFLNPELARSIFMSFKNLNGEERNVTLVLNRKAEDIFETLKNYTGV